MTRFSLEYKIWLTVVVVSYLTALIVIVGHKPRPQVRLGQPVHHPMTCVDARDTSNDNLDTPGAFAAKYQDAHEVEK